MRLACALSPIAHGAARDLFENCAAIVDRELASVTDNPAVAGTPEEPLVWSEAHAVAPALGQAADALAIAIAQIAAMSERRIDRLVNPLVSGLAPFLASDPGSHSGFMIAQYTAAALANENRRLAAPASTDGGLTSALQEDFLAHPTAAANKLLAVIDNAEYILAIEWLAATRPMIFWKPWRAEHRVRTRSTACSGRTSAITQTIGRSHPTWRRPGRSWRRRCLPIKLSEVREAPT